MKTARYLDKQTRITYQSEYKDERCRDKRALPFDFVVSKISDGKLLFAIQFDGIQHRKASIKFGGIPKFIERQKHDRIKDDFRKSINIPLIRINDYEIGKIDIIFDDELNKFSL